MPKRISQGARQRARTVRGVAMATAHPVARTLEVASFDVGDVVVERAAPHRLGRVCEVNVPGTIYRVFYTDAAQCAAAAHDGLAPAPSSPEVPACPGIC